MTIKDKVDSFLDRLEKNRSRRLGRGNVSVQRGRYVASRAWKKKRDSHPERLAGLNRLLRSH